jgi:gliding motility-associated-like protein
MSVTTTYVIDVSSEYGCKSSDSVTISIYCDNGQIYVPNTFTPNHDGKNDVFYPHGTGVSKVKAFRIYNRWGELLFERTNITLNDKSNAWDGTYDGNEPRPDVYVWYIEAECESGQQLSLKGDVTIIR